MSGLYLIGVIAIWFWITMLCWKVWQRLRAKHEGRRKHAVDAIGVAAGLLWFGVSVYYAGGRALLADMEVDRLCKKDGGIRVYETVRLPPDMFDEDGMVRIPSKDDARIQDKYYYEWEIDYYRKGNPELTRSLYRIVRRHDGKTLGETVTYSRGGGWLPGPWHGGSYICPLISRNHPPLETLVFIQGADQ